MRADEKHKTLVAMKIALCAAMAIGSMIPLWIMITRV